MMSPAPQMTRSRKESSSDSNSGNSSGLHEELHASLVIFLKKLGYRQTEQIFREEARSAGIETFAFELRAEQDSSLQPSILLEKLNEATNSNSSEISSGATNVALDSANNSTSSSFTSETLYEQLFGKLKKWAYDSLDIYRDELCLVLYPIFVHCYLDLIAKQSTAQAHKFFEKFKDEFKLQHGDELAKLKGLTDSSQLKENSIASIYRNNKYNLTMSAYSFQLIVNFLQENSMFLLLKILNQYLNIRVLVSRPSAGGLLANKAAAEKDAKPQGIAGLSASIQHQINSERLEWGVQALDSANEPEIMHRLRADLAASGTYKSQDLLNNAILQMKKNLVASPEAAPKTQSLSRPLASAAEIGLAVERIKGLSMRAALSSTVLPSVCCYTLHNGYESICSAEFSPDFALLAVGNRESYIDVWSLTKTRLHAIRPSTELSAMSVSDLESTERVFEREGTWSRRLVGHSGPVYACRFSPDNQFLFSASQDGSIRLWCLGTFSAIVAYKGHIGPVWDIDVGPSGHYFVSGSADRTVRLWTTQGMQPLRMFVGHLSDVDVVKFHPNSNYVLSGSSDKTIRMWDIHKGTCVRLFTGHTRGISALAVSPNGRYLASGDILGCVKIWDIAEGKLVKTLITADNSVAKCKTVYALAFCQDGKLLSACYADNSCRIWDAQKVTSLTSTDEQPLCVFPTKQTPLIAARFSPRNVLTVLGAFNSD